MSPLLNRLLRWFRRLADLVALALVVALIAVAATAYVAITAPHLPLLRWGLGHTGTVFNGQKTEDMRLSVHLRPGNTSLSGTAALRVRSIHDDRKRFYFLLNPELKIRKAERLRPETGSEPVRVYQIGPLLVLECEQSVAIDSAAEFTLEYEGKPWLASASMGRCDNSNILLNVDAFWYPVDAQSFFDADVTVRLPQQMTLVHSGIETNTAVLGDEKEVHWQSSRPVAGIALVAGSYRLFERQEDGLTQRLFLADDIQLDTQDVLHTMADVTRFLTGRLGPSGFDRTTIFVRRDFRRGFNDGSGTIGLSLRYFRSEDAGFGLIAHEIAHHWWGGTVTGGWLTPGHGAQWIVEGLAEFCSLLATEHRFGARGVSYRLSSEFFDPQRQQPVAAMSVLDNAFDEPRSRDTIYRKGAYVLWMLRDVVGDEACQESLRILAERFRYQHVSDQQIQAVFESASGQSLEEFFATWVRGNATLDLSLDPVDTGHARINNLGNAAYPGQVEVRSYPDDGSEPIRQTAAVGDLIDTPASSTIVVDPMLALADVRRENNRIPRREDPLYAAPAPNRSSLAIAVGDPFPWGRTAILHRDSEGRPMHNWELPRGLLQSPSWSADGSFLLTSVSNKDNLVPAIITLSHDNPQRIVGNGYTPSAGTEGRIYAARSNRILCFENGRRTNVVVEDPGKSVETLSVAPDGSRLAYVVAARNSIDLRVIGTDGSGGRSLLTWDRDRMVLRWVPDGTRLFAVMGKDAAWQIVAISPETGAMEILVRDAVAIEDLAVSPGGTHLAFTAAEERSYPYTRRDLYALDLAAKQVHKTEIPGVSLGSLAWESETSVLAIGSTLSENEWIYPQQRNLYRVEAMSGNFSVLH